MFQKRKRASFVSLSTATSSSPSLPNNMPPSATATATATTKTKTLPVTLSRFKDILLALSLLLILYLTFHAPPPPHPSISRFSFASPTTRHHVLFSIASSVASLPRRAPYLRLWYNPNTTRALVFLDRASPTPPDPTVPPAVISGDTSKFPYTFKGGLRSAIRVARVVKEAVENLDAAAGVRWLVFGDDDTVFAVENLVRILNKYDDNKWFYIGSNSESYEQNMNYSFDMAFGGGGFAISYSLARVLARVLDSCLVRYSHLYGSDARVFSCLAELGVGLTHEPGFHQVDMRGNLFGMLSAHPLSPFVSLHHLDAADPLFPNMSKTQALDHLFKAVNVDATRILQQVVCYDRKNSLTISVAWGYSIQVYEGNELLPDLLSVQRSFVPWRRSAKIGSSHYMFNMREYPRDPCKRPLVFFMESVKSGENGIWSYYRKYAFGNCPRANALKNLERIIVASQKLEPDVEEMKAPRRQCCDISLSSDDSMVINIRQCGSHELISMHS